MPAACVLLALAVVGGITFAYVSQPAPTPEIPAETTIPTEVKPQAGFETTDGKTYYRTEDGSLLIGRLKTDQGLLITAPDGTLAENYVSEGWANTDLFDETPQRYFFCQKDGHLYASTGFAQAALDGEDAWFYFRPETGRLTSGKAQTEQGLLVSKDNGVLAESLTDEGWYQGTDFDLLEQRYYFENIDGHLYALTGNFSVGGEDYYATEDEGFLSRNGKVWIDGCLYATCDDGSLVEAESFSGSRDEELATVSWANNPYYLEALAAKAQEAGSETDYVIVADYELCRLVVFQRTETLTASSGLEDLSDENRASNAYGFISITNRNSDTEWTAIKAYNGNFGEKPFAGIHQVAHKKEGNVLANALTLDNGEDNPSAYSTCYLESWAERAPHDYNWQDPDTGLWHDCASVHGTAEEKTGYDQEGCLGLLRQGARWVYDYVPEKSTVVIFD